MVVFNSMDICGFVESAELSYWFIFVDVGMELLRMFVSVSNLFQSAFFVTKR